jgi:hypothetical protein
MGIFITDQINTNVGIQLAGAYCSIRGSYNIRRRGDMYLLSACASIWANKQSYTANKGMIENPIMVEEVLTLQQLDDLLKTGIQSYGYIYNLLKTKLGYQNYNDDV